MSVKGVLIAFLVVIAAVIALAAILPEKDCAGNNTWKTAEVCQTDK